MPSARRTRRPLLALIVLLLLLAIGYAVQATRSQHHCAPAGRCAPTPPSTTSALEPVGPATNGWNRVLQLSVADRRRADVVVAIRTLNTGTRARPRFDYTAAAAR